METPLHVVHHKGFRYSCRMGFQEAPQGIREQFIEIRSPALRHVGTRPRGQLGRQLRLNHRFRYGRKLAPGMFA